jgi:broad specificity phosphatase PhoE
MTALVRYLSHPEVNIVPDIPVPEWSLSPLGQARSENFARAPWLSRTTQIVSSGERKALETAAPIARALGVEVEVREATHENDRSATGFMQPEEFQRTADEFFAQPEASIRGWERAIDAQKRIVREVDIVLERGIEGDVLFVGHGGVGTLLLCHLLSVGISRRHDQSGSGGNVFVFTASGRRVINQWRPMETPPEPGELPFL